MLLAMRSQRVVMFFAILSSFATLALAASVPLLELQSLERRDESIATTTEWLLNIPAGVVSTDNSTTPYLLAEYDRNWFAWPANLSHYKMHTIKGDKFLLRLASDTTPFTLIDFSHSQDNVLSASYVGSVQPNVTAHVHVDSLYNNTAIGGSGPMTVTPMHGVVSITANCASPYTFTVKTSDADGSVQTATGVKAVKAGFPSHRPSNVTISIAELPGSETTISYADPFPLTYGYFYATPNAPHITAAFDTFVQYC